ncbi:hypothetical protein [Photobacterium halotolerans]|uniref:Uncharacterized protein n=1 Tax=Photobacterium halotolerans TaxID=265726 RepID=A0A7X4W8K5_9GAMM|nr:hypothetical protein [Photobacterium halotolerans]NAW64073.1 hypothetical protein [Photobacterium halotolerans]
MKKSVLATLIISSLGLTACGGGSGSNNDSTDSNTSPTEVTTAGVVNKGIVKSGLVAVCEATVANTSQERCVSPLLTTTTNEKGQFSLTGLPANKALLVVVTKGNGTQMKCDYVGCQDANGNPIEFGEWMTVPNDFKLLAVIASSGEIKTANVNSLTNLAAKKAIELTGSLDLTTDIVNNSNAIIGKALGLTKPITEMGSVDITDANAIAGSDNEDLRAAILSASIEQSRKSGSVNIDDLIDYDANGKLAVNKNIVSQIQADTTQVVSQAKAHSKNQGNAGSKLDNADQDVSAIDPDNIEIGIDIDKPVANAVVQAKDFIKQIRTVYTAASDAGDLNTGLTNFADELSDISSIAQEDTEMLLENVNGAIIAISEAMKPDANFEGNMLLTNNNYYVYKDGDQYTVQQNGVSLVATGSYDHSTKTVTETDQNCNYSEFCTKTTTEEIRTNITLNELSANYNDAWLNTSQSHVVLSANITRKETGNYSSTPTNEGNIYVDESSTSEVSQVNTLKLQLSEATLTYFSYQENFSYPNTFSGNITLIADDISSADFNSYTYNENWNGSGADWSNESKDSSIIEAKSLTFKIDGVIASNGQAVSALMDIRLNNIGGYVHLRDITHTVSGRYCSWWSDWDNRCYTRSEEIITEESFETKDSFIRANVKMALGANILNANNTPVATGLSLDISRNDYNLIEVDAGVTYNGKDTYLSTSYKPYSDTNTPYVSLRDGKGLVATLTEKGEDDIGGTIYVNGKSTGTIGTTNNNLLLIRYTDGSFESM